MTYTNAPDARTSAVPPRAPNTRRLWRAASVFALAFAGLTCTDSHLTAPVRAGGPVHLAIAPSFETLPAGAPTIDLDKIRGVLLGLDGDSVVVQAQFDGDSAILVFDVSFTGQEGVFQLTLTAYDKSGQVVFSGIDTVHVAPGSNPPVQPTNPLTYSAPDAAVTTIHVVPNVVQLSAQQTGNLAVTGTNSGGQAVSPIHVGWTSRNTSVATVDANGVVTGGTSEGQTWVVARTATNVADSATVSVHAPIAGITVTPATPTVARGDSVRLSAALTDAGGNPITNRKPTWSSSDPSKATVSDSGWVKGVAIGAATITATAEGKSGTAQAAVVTPVASVSLAPSPVTLESVGATQALTATANPTTGEPVSLVNGLPVQWTTSSAAIATVSASGVVTAVANGDAAITATIDGVAGTDSVHVGQIATHLAISPPNTGVLGLHGQRRFTATATDARGAAIPPTALHWSSADPGVATVDGTGLATGVSVGLARIIVASGALADTALFSVSQSPFVIIGTLSPDTLSPGAHRAIVASVLDYSFVAIDGAAITYTALVPGVATVSSSGVVTGVTPGTGKVQLTSGSAPPDTVVFTIVSPSGGPGGLVINLSTVEKLPHGTQQFSVVSGGSGPYIWSVNGVDGGNSTYGTIDGTGFYTAPATVPSPSSFQVCVRRQAVPSDSACATVTIDPVPTAGADLFVVNDLNVFDNSYGLPDPDNVQFWKNLADFSSGGPRATQTGVLFDSRHLPICFPSYCSINYGYSGIAATYTSLGYTVTEASSPTGPGSITSIPSNIKLIFLVTPTAVYTDAEVNVLKQFAAEGGRIVYIGEFAGYFQPADFNTENSFLRRMGTADGNPDATVMTNIGGNYNCVQQSPLASVRPHQVTTGLNGLQFACASEVELGPNDYALFYDVSNTHVLAAIAKVDLTPLVISSSRAPVTSPFSASVAPAGQRTIDPAVRTGVDPKAAKRPGHN